MKGHPQSRSIDYADLVASAPSISVVLRKGLGSCDASQQLRQPPPSVPHPLGMDLRWGDTIVSRGSLKMESMVAAATALGEQLAEKRIILLFDDDAAEGSPAEASSLLPVVLYM